MRTTFTAITTSTTMSALLHVAVLAGLLFSYQPSGSTDEGVEIQLVSSADVPGQPETGQPETGQPETGQSETGRQEVADSATDETTVDSAVDSALDTTPDVVADSNLQKQLQAKLFDKPLSQRPSERQWPSERQRTSENKIQQLDAQQVTAADALGRDTISPDTISHDKRAVDDKIVHTQNSKAGDARHALTAEELISVSDIRSNHAAGQQQNIITLLHQSISSNKEYPYMAVRQRREGIARIGFVLYPDGSVKHAHLIASSSTGSLDRAALTAVKHIDPFRPAQQYLEQAQAFEIDVVFELL